jgi:hypothetical protein
LAVAARRGQGDRQATHQEVPREVRFVARERVGRPEGTPSRATIRAKSLKLPVAGVNVGQTVPLHVNRRGTRAVFGRFATGEDRAKRRQREKQQRARDEQRFTDKLEES